MKTDLNRIYQDLLENPDDWEKLEKMLVVTKENILQHAKNSQQDEVPIHIIEIEESDLTEFRNINWSERNPVILKIRLEEEVVKNYNKTGELALILERVIEKNIILNKLSLEQPSLLLSNINWYNHSLDIEVMAADLKRKSKKKLKETHTLQEETAYALDPAIGGNANMFLNSPRKIQIDQVIGSSWNHAGRIIPGREHVIKVVVLVKSDGRNLLFAVEDYLELNNQKLNVDRLITRKV